MPSSIETVNLLQYAFVIPVAATIGGWFVVARQSDRREFRKEVRDQLKELRERTDAISQRANEYWLETDDDKAVVPAITLKAEIARVARQVRALQTSGLSFEATSLLVELREYATGGQFEVKGRVRSAADVERLADIAGSIEDLLSEGDNAFHREFKPPKKLRSPWAYIPLLGFLIVHRD